MSNASLAKAFRVQTRPHFFLLCAALGPGSELVVLVFEQDVERGERSVAALDILVAGRIHVTLQLLIGMRPLFSE